MKSHGMNHQFIMDIHLQIDFNIHDKAQKQDTTHLPHLVQILSYQIITQSNWYMRSSFLKLLHFSVSHIEPSLPQRQIINSIRMQMTGHYTSFYYHFITQNYPSIQFTTIIDYLQQQKPANHSSSSDNTNIPIIFCSQNEIPYLLFFLFFIIITLNKNQISSKKDNLNHNLYIKIPLNPINLIHQSIIGLIIYRPHMQSQKSLLQFEHFRNAIAQSWVKKGNFHGIALIITDYAEILIGEFYEGDLHGWYLLLAEDHYSYGNANKNKMEGFAIIKNQTSTVFGNFKNDLLEGIAVIVKQSENKVQVVEYEKGRQAIQVDQKQLAGTSISELLTKFLGKTQFTPREYLSSKVCHLQKYGIFEKQIGANLRYFGFMNNQKNLGLVFNGDFLQSFGQYRDLALNGLGRFIEINSNVFDGVFQKGDWLEEGVQYKKIQNSMNKQVISFRKQHHLKQMEFNNCHFILKQFLNIGDINFKPPQKFSSVQQLLNIRSRRTTSSFREQSPLKQKLRTYQKEAAKYLNNEQVLVRSYTRTIDVGKQQIIPAVSFSNKGSQYSNNQKQQFEQEQDIYQLVRKMQLQQSLKRTQLNQMIQTRNRTTL